MLIVSIAALLAYGLVMLRCALFALDAKPHRQADSAEVGYIVTGSILYVLAYLCLWLFEPWKLITNSPASVMFVMFTIFTAAYFYRRVGALIVGRERRTSERRIEDRDGEDRRVRRPPE